MQTPLGMSAIWSQWDEKRKPASAAGYGAFDPKGSSSDRSLDHLVCECECGDPAAANGDNGYLKANEIGR